MKALLLAGGYGTRLKPLTWNRNKHLLPIANKPMLFYGLGNLIRAGIKEIFVILGPVKDDVIEALGDGSQYGVKVEYIEQSEPKGLAHAVLISEPYIGDVPFIMYLGDNILQEGVEPIVRRFRDHKGDCVITVKPVPNPSLYGIAEMQNGRVTKLIEKPKQSKSNLAVIGVYAFGSAIFDAAKKIRPSWRNELEIADAIQYLIDNGGNVDAKFVEGWWKDAGSPEDLLEANQLVLRELDPEIKGTIHEDVNIEGNVSIGDKTLVRKSSHLTGPIIIGNNCEIGPDVSIGPYTSIGDNCMIQEAELENCIVMKNVQIRREQRVVDSIIDEGSRIRCY